MIDQAPSAMTGRVNPYTRRFSRSLPAPRGDVIPEQPIQGARAAFPKGHP